MNNNNKIFDINTYSETSNPMLSALFRELQNSTNLGKTSKDVENIQRENSDIYDKFQEFLNILNNEQQGLYNNFFSALNDEYVQEEMECFNIGFKLCAKLMVEIFS